MTLMAVDKTSFRVAGKNICCQCQKYLVMTVRGAPFFTEVTKLDVFPNIAGAPSVQRV
jgi:hypothetical protein